MLEKLLLSMGAITLSVGSVGGYAWAEGGLGPSSDTTSVAQPTWVALSPGRHGYGNAVPIPVPESAAANRRSTQPGVPSAPKRRRTQGAVAGASNPAPFVSGATTPGMLAATDQQPVVDPAPAAGTPTQSGPSPASAPAPAPVTPGAAADFTMATFNLLGSSHTNGHGHSPSMASGPDRMNGALQILAQHQVSVVGLQEFQPDQRQAFQSRAAGWNMYPGLSMGRRAGENSVAWRTDTWDLVRTALIDIPYFNGRERPMPYVLLRNKASGAQAYFSTFHNPANIGGDMQRWRTEATTREIALFNRLETTGVPQLVTGDMNERSEYFCRITGGTRLTAAAGGSSAGACRAPKPTQIDWIFGSPSVKFSDYVVDKSPLVRRTTDHPVVVTRVHLGAGSPAPASTPTG